MNVSSIVSFQNGKIVIEILIKKKKSKMNCLRSIGVILSSSLHV